MENKDLKIEMQNVKYAGFWIRHLAVAIDTIIFFIISIIFAILLNLITPNNQDLTENIYNIFTIIFSIFYFWILHYFWGQTPWKMAMWIKVVKKTWENISFLQSIWRVFATIISSLPFMLWYFWAWWNKKKKTFHDMLAWTVVIEIRETSWVLIFILNFLISILSIFILTIFIGIILFAIVLQENPAIIFDILPLLPPEAVNEIFTNLGLNIDNIDPQNLNPQDKIKILEMIQKDSWIDLPQ